MFFSEYFLSLFVFLKIMSVVMASLSCRSSCIGKGNVAFPCMLEKFGIYDPGGMRTKECGPAKPRGPVCNQTQGEGETTLLLSWRPPGLSSAKDVKGFLIFVSTPTGGRLVPTQYIMNLSMAGEFLADPNSALSVVCVYNREGLYQDAHVTLISTPVSTMGSCDRQRTSISCHMEASVLPSATTINNQHDAISTELSTDVPVSPHLHHREIAIAICISAFIIIVVVILTRIIFRKKHCFVQYSTRKRQYCSSHQLEKSHACNNNNSTEQYIMVEHLGQEDKDIAIEIAETELPTLKTDQNIVVQSDEDRNRNKDSINIIKKDLGRLKDEIGDKTDSGFEDTLNCTNHHEEHKDDVTSSCHNEHMTEAVGYEQECFPVLSNEDIKQMEKKIMSFNDINYVILRETIH